VEAEVGELRLVYDASNYVFLATLAHDEHGEGLGIYKPAQGERPLHDFPSGTLYEREVGAYQLSRLLGWNLIPPTVERDGPQGVGSMQLYIQHDPSEHYFNFREQDSLHEQLVRFAAFDLVANNADRKAGHLLLDGDGRLWGIDNGLCFHGQQKLRTVVWDFAGEPLPAGWVEDLERAAECIDSGDESAEALRRCLSEREREALAARCRELADRPVLPEMFPYRCVPWPMI
jgi:uncharacterized repeat protein (TIGR03843 family)